ncbi:MAG: penicillin-binding protein 2 [Gammaproteobacteria bacterium]|nr:penicillin-binding protein 2 [Gammaproteobacteria bacterium]MYE81956.1 penicillin-binding protein 2 [Gammaproteobacteria bacterium]
MSWRHHLLAGLFVAGAAALIARVGHLAVTERDFLQKQGEARAVRVVPIPVHRGIIYDRHGEPLAVSTPVYSVWTDPGRTPIPGGRYVDLATALGLPVGRMSRLLERNADSRFAYLRRHVDPATAERVRALDIPGVRFRREYRRFYPAAETTAHVVGMTNIDDAGQEGIELVLDAFLRGRPGEKRVLRDRNGRSVKDLAYLRAPEFGKDVMLSLDLRLQFFAHSELKAAVEHNRAKSGALVMLDVATGEVLAMANQPSYNPNNPVDRGSPGMRNRAVTDTYEPGSTIKPLSVLAALESGRYFPDTPVDTTPGYIRIGSKLIEDPSNRGRLTLAEVLAKSSQVGITQVALDLPEHAIFDVVARAGLGEVPGTHLPGETVGVFTSRDLDKDIGRATLAFGYGLTVTPLQLARTYLTLATGGVRRPVSVIRDAPAPASERVFDARDVRDVSRMMERVASPEGTAPLARVAGYRVVGKTGTTRKVSPVGYDDSRHVALFAGYAPAHAPRIVVVVVIDEPTAGLIGGGSVAAPVFSRVVARALRILGIAPEESRAIAKAAAKYRTGHGALA